MPAFASRPLEPVTTTLAIAESRMSCTFWSGGMKLFKKTNIRFNLVGSVPKRPSRCQRNSDPGASANRSRYAICAAKPVVLSVAVSQTSRRKTRQMNPRYFIAGRVYFAPRKYPLKSPAVARLSRVDSHQRCDSEQSEESSYFQSKPSSGKLRLYGHSYT